MATIGTRIFFPSPIVFVDADDGTLIHIFPTGNPGNPCGNETVIGFAQSVKPNDPCSDLEIGEPITASCGFFTITQNLTLHLDTTEPLPSDFNFSGGSVSRFSDRLSLFLEEFTPSRAPGLFPPIDPGSLLPDASELVRNFITRYDFVNVESLGLTDGTQFQTLSVSGSKIVTPTKGNPIVTVDGNRWTKIDDVLTAGPGDEVFEYAPDTGTVKFGNGAQGKIPPVGQEVILKITIRNGGGQWQFAGIVEQPRSDSNIGILKGARDKLVYGQVKIAGADISQLTTIESEMKVLVQKEVFGGTTLNEVRYWSLNLGGKATFDGGSPFLLRVGQGQNFFSAAASLVESCQPPQYKPGVSSTGGYPSASLSIAAHSTGQIKQVAKPFDPAFEPIFRSPGSECQLGIVTSPERYIIYLEVIPIIEVWEYIQHGSIRFETPPTCDNPCPPVVFESRPFYAMAWYIWSDLYVRIGVHPNGATRSNAANFDAFLRSNRKNALVEIADKVGTFDSPPKPDLTKEKWSVHGNFFWRKVDGDATRHPEWVRAVREHKPNDDPYMRHIGFPVLPGFNMTATAIEGEVFNLPDLVWSVKSTPTSCPGGTKNICSLTNNANDVSDVRIQGIKSFILSPPTFIFEPPVPQ